MAELRRRVRARTAVRDRERAEIILLRIEGLSVVAVAERLKRRQSASRRGRNGSRRHGLDGLVDSGGARPQAVVAGEKDRA